MLALYEDKDGVYANSLSRECILAGDVAMGAQYPSRYSDPLFAETYPGIKFDAASNAIINSKNADSMVKIEAYIQDRSDRCICKEAGSKALFLYFLVASVLNTDLSKLSPEVVKRAVCELFGDGAACIPASFVEEDQTMGDVYALFKHLIP